jgi:hypothetical protein
MVACFNRKFVAALALFGSLCATLEAASPRVAAIGPWGSQRGQTVNVRIDGDRLADAAEILWYSPGFTVSEFTAHPENYVTAKLQIAGDCPLGLHAFRVRTQSGLSNLLTYSVGNLPELSEAEPNNDFQQPQPIPLNTTVNGVVTGEDVDYFQIEVKKGQRINLELEGVRLGYSFFDAYVAVLDVNRFEIASNDDASLVRQDCICSFVAAEDGKYVVQVRETSFRGDVSCRYRLHVGTFPRPIAAMPLGGKPGESLEVRWLGDPVGERAQQVLLPTESSNKFCLYAQDEHGMAPTGNPFRISDLPNVFEAEPNVDPSQANAITPPCAVQGIIAETNDIDRFKFAATKGQVFDIRVFARRMGSPLDSVLTIQQVGKGIILGNDDNAGSPDSYGRITVPEDGEYMVSVQDQLLRGGPDFAYRVEIAPPAQQLRMTLPELDQFADTVVPLPRGNRFAIMVGTERDDFFADIQYDFANLPAGVQVESMPIVKDQFIVPVVFTAAADAEIAGRLVELNGRSTDPNLPIAGHLHQRSSLVRGDNNRDITHFDTERMAVAVTQECPFTIEIVEPKCPIVRGGSMSLKVRAQRKEGFTKPINLRFLYAPPGLGVNNALQIAEGANEVDLPLTATGDAALGVWKLVVLGRADTDGGPVTVSSQLAPVEIAEPYLSATFQAASVEQGQKVDLLLKVQKLRDWEGPAKLELLGTPHEVTTEPREIGMDATEVTFPLTTTANSPAGKHTTVICRAVVMVNGEPVTHGFGGSELRIDVPLPPKPTEPAKEAAPVVAEAPKPADKPLSRLEKLRQARAQP